MTDQALHQPVMLAKAIEYLNIQADAWYIDATFGRGGHTQAILDKQARVVAFDVDQEAITYGQKKFQSEIESHRLFLIQANFVQLESEISKLKQSHQALTAIHGVLFDFGTSLDQVRASHRGFSFQHGGAPLDMRMDTNLGVTAADLLNILSTKQLTQLFREFGGEQQAKKIAQAIDRYRGKDRINKIETVSELVEIISQVKKRRSHLHPATKVFQALRIAVNDELGSIEQALPQALKIIASGARIAAISFHEGEDRIVKHSFRNWENLNAGQALTPKPIRPAEDELKKNPSARSAKLRAFEKDKTSTD